MITVARLEGFYWVARTGGYARAARAFPWPITQPAVHQQVKKLERELGVPLFERFGKDRVQPTAAGRELLRLVAPLFDGLPALLQRLRGGRYGGPLRLAVDPLVLRHLLPPWLARLRAQHPDVAPSLAELDHASTAGLLAGDCDAAIGYLPEPGAGVAVRPVGAVHPVVVLPTAAIGRQRRELSLRRLRELPFLGYPEGSVAGRLQQQALARRRLPHRPGLVAPTAETLLALVAEGLGWSIVPWPTAAGPRLPGVFVWPLRRPRVAFPIVVAWRATGASPLVDALLATAPEPAPRAAARR